MNDEPLQYLAAAKRHADNAPAPRALISAEAERQLSFAYRVIAGLILGTIIVTGWVVKIQIQVSTVREDLIEQKSTVRGNSTAIDGMKTAIDVKSASDVAAAQAVAATIEVNKTAAVNQISNLKEQLAEVQKTVPWTTEMWFMMQHGESNQDAFKQRNGYYAPSDPRSFATPPPAPRR